MKVRGHREQEDIPLPSARRGSIRSVESAANDLSKSIDGALPQQDQPSHRFSIQKESVFISVIKTCCKGVRRDARVMMMMIQTLGGISTVRSPSDDLI